MNEHIYMNKSIALQQLEEQRRKQMDETTAYPSACAEYRPLRDAVPVLTKEEPILSRIAQLEQRTELMTKDAEESARQLFQRVERIERALGL